MILTVEQIKNNPKILEKLKINQNLCSKCNKPIGHEDDNIYKIKGFICCSDCYYEASDLLFR